MYILRSRNTLGIGIVAAASIFAATAISGNSLSSRFFVVAVVILALFALVVCLSMIAANKGKPTKFSLLPEHDGKPLDTRVQ